MKKLFKIDASLLGQSGCQRKVDLIHNEGLTTEEGAYKMDYGTGGHKFVGAYRSGLNPEDALKVALEWFLPKCINVPVEDFRTIDHLSQTCIAYARFYPRESDPIRTEIINGKPAVELSFSVPFMTTPDFDITLCGTIDERAKFDGRPVIVDRKFTALWDQDNFLKSFELSPQMKLYSWICKTYGLTDYYPPAIIDGIFLKKPTQKTWNKVLNKYEPSKGFNGASFKRSFLIEFSPESMGEFEQWLRWKVGQIIKSHMDGCWQPDFNQCSGKFGMCEFSELCLGRLTKAHYLKREYDPLMFQT